MPPKMSARALLWRGLGVLVTAIVASQIYGSLILNSEVHVSASANG